ncbi:MAG: hypothetical protein AVDCRST_MAG12-529, partial [uncultured Rubrobacteraceae bacterium]
KRRRQHNREREWWQLNVIDIGGLKPPGSNTARFVGADHGAGAIGGTPQG